jgi:peptidylprolyl isomerase
MCAVDTTTTMEPVSLARALSAAVGSDPRARGCDESDRIGSGLRTTSLFASLNQTHKVMFASTATRVAIIAPRTTRGLISSSSSSSTRRVVAPRASSATDDESTTTRRAALTALTGATVAAFSTSTARARGLGPSFECADELKTAASGLAFCDAVVGTGAAPSKGQTIQAHYTGRLENGRVFDSSYERGSPLKFKVGVRQVIAGWDEGILGDGGDVPAMKVGGRRRLVIPADMGYGARGAGGVIPPNATLYFDVELVAVL